MMGIVVLCIRVRERLLYTTNDIHIGGMLSVQTAAEFICSTMCLSHGFKNELFSMPQVAEFTLNAEP